MDDQERMLVTRYEIAAKKVSQSMVTSKGGSQAEAEYADAYQSLVKAGLRQQIKLKYRGRK